jgi:hypothetical protein
VVGRNEFEAEACSRATWTLRWAAMRPLIFVGVRVGLIKLSYAIGRCRDVLLLEAADGVEWKG